MSRNALMNRRRDRLSIRDRWTHTVRSLITVLMLLRSSPKRRTARRSISISVSVHLALKTNTHWAQCKDDIITTVITITTILLSPTSPECDDSSLHVPDSYKIQAVKTNTGLWLCVCVCLTLPGWSLTPGAAAWSAPPAWWTQLQQQRRSPPPAGRKSSNMWVLLLKVKEKTKQTGVKQTTCNCDVL